MDAVVARRVFGITVLLIHTADLKEVKSYSPNTSKLGQYYRPMFGTFFFTKRHIYYIKIVIYQLRLRIKNNLKDAFLRDVYLRKKNNSVTNYYGHQRSAVQSTSTSNDTNQYKATVVGMTTLRRLLAVAKTLIRGGTLHQPRTV